MPIINCEQGSLAWFMERCGRVTGSRVADAMSFLKKGGESQARRAYKAEIVCELLTGKAVEHFVTKEMEFGILNEPFARAAYELQNDVSVEDVGFAIHPSLERFGASPDGLVGEDGLIEIKCPSTATHLDYLLADAVPDDYKPQMLAEMACAERQWVDFISFDPRLPKRLQLFVKRFLRDDQKIAEMEFQVVEFLREVDSIMARLADFSCVEALENSISTPF